MGYRSEVHIKVQQQHKLSLLDIFASNDITFDEASEDNDHFYCILYDRKWYDGYTDVDAVNSFINSLEDEGALVRIGEETGDVETIGYPYEVGLSAYTVVEDEDSMNQIDPTNLMYSDFKKYKETYPEYFL